jgi:hypothetical protein
MIMTLDNLAHRYGKLPSEIIANSSTFDLYVMDAAASYRDYQQRKAEGKVAVDYTVDELQDIMKRTKTNA